MNIDEKYLVELNRLKDWIFSEFDIEIPLEEFDKMIQVVDLTTYCKERFPHYDNLEVYWEKRLLDGLIKIFTSTKYIGITNYDIRIDELMKDPKRLPAIWEAIESSFNLTMPDLRINKKYSNAQALICFVMALGSFVFNFTFFWEDEYFGDLIEYLIVLAIVSVLITGGLLYISEKLLTPFYVQKTGTLTIKQLFKKIVVKNSSRAKMESHLDRSIKKYLQNHFNLPKDTINGASELGTLLGKVSG